MAHGKRTDASLRGYLNGVVALAARCAKQAGRSDISVDVYAADAFPRAFLKSYRIRKEVVLRETGETFSQALSQWLGEGDPVVTHVTELFEYELGKAKRVLRAADESALCGDLSGSEHGFGAYWFTEDVFFVAFETQTLVFLMGNND